jgi:hypothetical protein
VFGAAKIDKKTRILYDCYANITRICSVGAKGNGRKMEK